MTWTITGLAIFATLCVMCGAVAGAMLMAVCKVSSTVCREDEREEDD